MSKKKDRKKKTWKVPTVRAKKAAKVVGASRSLKAGKANGPAAKRTKTKSPRSQALPGMEQTRNVKLDNICEGIGDERRTMNAAKTEEQGLIQGALQLMQQKGIQVYKHGGVELARVPGSEKLRVRLTKETGDADEGDLESGESDDQSVDEVVDGLQTSDEVH